MCVERARESECVCVCVFKFFDLVSVWQAVEFVEALGKDARNLIDYIEEPLHDANQLPQFCKFLIPSS